MHIQSIEVEDFGTIKQLEAELEDGLNVISGPNEAGKSTLMRAAWMCLMWPCRSQSEEVRSIVPNRGGTPKVRVVLSVDGSTYAMEKTFNQSGGTAHLRVQESGGSIDDFADDEAEDVLRSAIGVGELGGRPKSPTHYGFWPAVWTRQDERHLDPGKHLTDRGSRDSLSSILAEIGGDVLAGSGADIVEKAKEEYERFYTNSGNLTKRAGAPLHEAQERHDEVHGQFEKLQETRQNYENDLDAYESLRREVDELKEELPALETEAQEAAEEFARVEKLQGNLDQEKTRLEAKETTVEQAEGRVERRDALRGEIRELESDLEGIVEQIEEQQDLIDSHGETREELEEQKEEAQKERKRLKGKERLLRTHLEVLHAEDRLEEIASRSDRYDDLVGERRDLQAEREGISIDEGDIERLEELKRARDQTQTRLETAAARVSVEGSSDFEIRIGDLHVDLSEGNSEEHIVDSRTTVHVGSDLRINVEPGGEDLAKIRSEAEAAEEEYQDTLDDLGVGSVADARGEVRKKDQIDSRLESIAQEIERLLPEGSDDLGEAQTRAEARAEDARDERSKLAEEDEIESLPDDEEAVREQLQQADRELSTADEALTEARAELEDHDATTQALREDLKQLQTKKTGKEESLESVNGELDQHVDEYGTDDEIQGALAEARDERDEKKKEVERIRGELDDLNAESIEARKERTERALGEAESDKDELEERLNRVEGRLERNELHGLHEQLEKARQKEEDAEAEVNRLKKQAEAAKLLYETLTEKRAEARKRYLAPLREEVEQLLNRFFGAEKSTVEFDEDLALEKISRSKDGSLSFDQLSAGAKQQLSLLIRLAMARLVARERPHPVFLDDALSDTDPERFDVLGDILHGVSQEMQIIMTTCHRSRHRKLGANSLRMEALKQGR